MASRLVHRIGFTAFLWLLASATSADVKLPAIFGDHMVLQGGVRIPLWGTADAGERVVVKAAGQERAATADDHGRWRLKLDPITAMDPFQITINGKNVITLKDVLAGEVWLCSGQSNMSYPVHSASTGAAALQAANRPMLRFFKVERAYKDTPQTDLAGKWELSTPESAKDFSAVGYFFACDLLKDVKTPVGLIESDWGGTRAEAWLRKDVFDALKLPYEPQWTEQWLHPKPPEKERPYEAPAVIYNGMIAPITGYAMKGMIWYQGETNTAYPDHYRNVLNSLVTSWRTAWGEGDFPVVIVQLANFGSHTRDWVTLRASQTQVVRDLPNMGMAVTLDVGNPKDIHYTDKETVGHRVALVAERIAYGHDIPYMGPRFKSMVVNGAVATISFDNVYEGLLAKGGEVQGFELAGPDGKFIAAKAKIDGSKVVVSADGIAMPTAVRYAWANDPKCTLYNKAGLPAQPFEAKAQ
jgi:sialate O-acetylesterase